MLRTLQYLNASMKSSRFSAVELVRFAGADHAAFEARVVAAAEPPKGVTRTGKTALAGVDDLCATITDDEYRHHLQDLFDPLSSLDGLSVFWGRLAARSGWPCQTGFLCRSAGYFPPGRRGGWDSLT